MKRQTTFLVAFMALAIALNYVGANIALLLRLPIYLDTIGTVLVAISFGPWLGVLTAVLAALISWATTDIFAIYYAPVAMIISLLFGYFVRPDANKSSIWWKTILISLAGTVVASLITVQLFGGITSSGSSILVQILRGTGLDLLTSSVLVQLVTDYADRLLTITVAVLIYSRVSSGVFNQLATAKKSRS